MVQRAERIAEFIIDRELATDAAVQLLCEDHVGTYTLPFLCRRVAGGWTNERTGTLIEAEVLGWRRRLDSQHDRRLRAASVT